MAVRKRTWTTRKGERKEAWVVDHVDQDGHRHIKTYGRKKDADKAAAEIGVAIAAGVYTAASRSITLAQAGTDWLKHAERKKVGRGTLAMYGQHVAHITKRLGASKKLSSLTKPDVVKFRNKMLDDEMSLPMARKVMTSLVSLLNVAHEQGNVAQNVARSVKVTGDKRGRARLQVGTDIPTVVEVQRLLAAAKGKMKALLHVAAFAGLRASELRGLRWEDVDFTRRVINVQQRADRYNEIGQPKSRAGERAIPVMPMVVNTLREWKLQCPKSEGDLVFPTRTGLPSDHKALVRLLQLVSEHAGVMVPVLDKHGKPVVGDDGEPVMTAKYTGLHTLRHFYASWCINRPQEGGLGLPVKTVQARLGHASIVMTMDRYGHLFPADDGSEMVEAERRFLSAV